MTTSDMKKSLLDAGRKHFALCLKVSAESRSMSDALDQAVDSLPIESLRRAATGRNEASWLIYAAPEAQIEGYPYTFYADYIFNCSIYVAAQERKLGEPLLSRAGEGAASALEMMMLTSLKSGEYGFVLDPGGKLLDRMGDKLGVAFYKVEVRALQVAAIRYLQNESASKMDLLSAELRLEKLRAEASQLMAVARRQCEGDEQRIARLGQFEQMLRL